MRSKPLIAAAIAAAFGVGSAGAIAEDKQRSRQSPSTSPGAKQGASAAASGGRQQGGEASSGASASAPATIVLVPVQVAARDNFANGCWARLYDGGDFRGNQLSLVGPVDMPNMRTAFGTDWGGEFDSIHVGPRARLTVYNDENFREKSATFKPGQRVPELDERMGLFRDVRSVKVACTGGGPPAQNGQGQGSAGGTSAGGGALGGSSGRSGSSSSNR